MPSMMTPTTCTGPSPSSHRVSALSWRNSGDLEAGVKEGSTLESDRSVAAEQVFELARGHPLDHRLHPNR